LSATRVKVVVSDINLKGAERVAREITDASDAATAITVITGGYNLVDEGYTAI
jgi:hypothetical protein